MKKIISVFLTIFMLTAVFTGCSNENNSESSVKMSDLPYGSTMVDDNKTYNVPLLYDKRFLEADQLKAITDYYYAIETNNLESYNSTMIPIYSEYIKANSSTGDADSKYMLENANSSLNVMIGENFEFILCEITDITSEHTISGVDTILEKMDLVSVEIDGTKISDKVTKAYSLKIDFTVKSGENSTTVADDIIFLFEIDDKIYVMI